jgi:hypothetical protein
MHKIGTALIVTLMASSIFFMQQASTPQPALAERSDGPKQVTLKDLGVLQLVSHDIYNVNRETEVDSENQKLDLSTLFNYGEENIATGGEPRNSENIAVFTVATHLAKKYYGFIEDGDSPEEAREYTIDIYHRMVKKAYKHTFDEKAPRPEAEEEEEGDLTGDLALRTVHALLPGKITVDGVEMSTLDPSLHGKTLSNRDMKQLSKPLDDTFDPAFRNITVFLPPDTIFTIDLFERDSSFAEQFDTDYTFEFFMAELADGHYDPDDTAMNIIREEIAGALLLEEE